MNARLIATLFCLALFVNGAACVQAASTVFVDFSMDMTSGAPWGGNLDVLAGEVGFDPLSMMEVGDLEMTIMDELMRIYSGFDVSFIPMPPPSTATNVIDFTKDLSSSVLLPGSATSLPKGIADYDWLNRQFFPAPRTYQLGEVFPQSFDDIVDEWADSTADARPGMIGELGIALGGTAAHELGHSYGLSHHDAYGDPSLGPATTGPLPGEFILTGTGGFQNSHVMATGDTGITELERESMRTLSRYAKAKLEIASDPTVTSETLGAMPFGHTDELPATHDMMATAQPLAGAPLPISGLNAVNVHAASLGDLPGGGTFSDFYTFEVLMDGLVTAEVVSKRAYAPSLETVVTIYDDAGTVLFAGDDLGYDLMTMMFTSSVFDVFLDGIEDDPLVMNMLLTAGTYFVEVSVDGDGSHSSDPLDTELFYDLFITSEGVFVPEPTAAVLLQLSLMLLIVRRGQRSWGEPS